MFVGHLGVALAAKKATPTTSLVWLIAAANLVDLVWPVFLLAGLEQVRINPGNTAFTPLDFQSYPWTHSLLMGVAWGVAFGAVARWRGVSATGAVIASALVVSHWVLDLVTHRPDLPLWPHADSVYGLGLWRSIPGTFVVEGLLWVVAIAIFLRVRRPRGLQGQLALWSFVGVSTLLWATGPFSPPPPNAHALAQFALLGWIVVPWAWWIERTSGR
jgi:hypothetical protein